MCKKIVFVTGQVPVASQPLDFCIASVATQVIAPKTATKPQKVMWMDPLTGAHTGR